MKFDVTIKNINLGLNLIMMCFVVINLWFFGEMALKYNLTPASYLPYMGLLQVIGVILLNFKIKKI